MVDVLDSKYVDLLGFTETEIRKTILAKNKRNSLSEIE